MKLVLANCFSNNWIFIVENRSVSRKRYTGRLIKRGGPTAASEASNNRGCQYIVADDDDYTELQELVLLHTEL